MKSKQHKFLVWPGLLLAALILLFSFGLFPYNLLSNMEYSVLLSFHLNVSQMLFLGRLLLILLTIATYVALIYCSDVDAHVAFLISCVVFLTPGFFFLIVHPVALLWALSYTGVAGLVFSAPLLAFVGAGAIEEIARQKFDRGVVGFVLGVIVAWFLGPFYGSLVLLPFFVEEMRQCEEINIYAPTLFVGFLMLSYGLVFAISTAFIAFLILFVVDYTYKLSEHHSPVLVYLVVFTLLFLACMNGVDASKNHLTQAEISLYKHAASSPECARVYVLDYGSAYQYYTGKRADTISGQDLLKNAVPQTGTCLVLSARALDHAFTGKPVVFHYTSQVSIGTQTQTTYAYYLTNDADYVLYNVLDGGSLAFKDYVLSKNPFGPSITSKQFTYLLLTGGMQSINIPFVDVVQLFNMNATSSNVRLIDIYGHEQSMLANYLNQLHASQLYNDSAGAVFVYKG